MPLPMHGYSGYVNRKCRCEKCKAGMSAYFRSYRAKRLRERKCQRCQAPTVDGKWLCAEHGEAARLFHAARRAAKRAAKEISHVAA